eukprot:2266499-Rhodomonas_salina.1
MSFPPIHLAAVPVSSSACARLLSFWGLATSPSCHPRPLSACPALLAVDRSSDHSPTGTYVLPPPGNLQIEMCYETSHASGCGKVRAPQMSCWVSSKLMV